MTTTDRASLITDLYALRSQAGALFVRANAERKLNVAVKIGNARDEITEAISTLENEPATTTTPLRNDPAPGHPGTENGTAPR